MRIFILTPGRTASSTVAHACKFITGMTAGHESNRRTIQGRMNYPDNHIEVDNRLSWFLGTLDRLYDDEETVYVYLKRDKKRVAASYIRRWNIRVSIVRGFYTSILMHQKKATEQQKLDSSELYVQTVEDNIVAFLRRKPRTAEIRVENLEQDFFAFMESCGLSGDTETIRAALSEVHNRNREKKSGWQKARSLFR